MKYIKLFEEVTKQSVLQQVFQHKIDWELLRKIEDLFLQVSDSSDYKLLLSATLETPSDKSIIWNLDTWNDSWYMSPLVSNGTYKILDHTLNRLIKDYNEYGFTYFFTLTNTGSRDIPGSITGVPDEVIERFWNRVKSKCPRIIVVREDLSYVKVFKSDKNIEKIESR